MTARTTFGPALLAALLAGGMSLADPGPGQILGFEGAASQILVSFSAQYDFSLAARQCLALTGAALIAVLPAAVRARVAIEAGITQGWHRWVGDAGAVIGLDHFGASAPAETLYREFGLTAEAVTARAREVLAALS